MDNNISVMRLLRLAQFLEDRVPKHNFDLGSWSNVSGKTRIEPKFDVTTVTQNECGTTACACGWAATMPEFNAEGFYMDRDPGRSTGWIHYVDPENSEDGEYSGFRAAEAFFGLTEDEGQDLFYEGRYPINDKGVTAVVKKIRGLVETKYGIVIK